MGTSVKLISEGEYEIKNRIESYTGDIIFSIEKEKKYIYTYSYEYGGAIKKNKTKREIAYRNRIKKNPDNFYLWLKKYPLLFGLFINLKIIKSLETPFDIRVEDGYRKAQYKLKEIEDGIKRQIENEAIRRHEQKNKEEQNYYNASDALQRAKKNVNLEIRTIDWLEPLVNKTSYLIEKGIKRAEQNDDFIGSMALLQLRSSLGEVSNCSYNDPEAAELAKNEIIETLKNIEQRAAKYYNAALQEKGRIIKASVESQKEICNA